MKRLVIKTHGHKTPKVIQDPRLISRETAEGVLGVDTHACGQGGDIAAHIRHTVDSQQDIAVVIGERKDATRPVVLEAAREVRDALGGEG